jgi:hypothetical protein
LVVRGAGSTGLIAWASLAFISARMVRSAALPWKAMAWPTVTPGAACSGLSACAGASRDREIAVATSVDFRTDLLMTAPLVLRCRSYTQGPCQAKTAYNSLI